MIFIEIFGENVTNDDIKSDKETELYTPSDSIFFEV